MNVVVIQKDINFKYAEVALGNGRVVFTIDFNYDFLDEEGATYSEPDYEGGFEYDFIVRDGVLQADRTRINVIESNKGSRLWKRDEQTTEPVNILIHKS